MFFGFLPDIQSKFKKRDELKAVFSYLNEALDETSEMNIRISSLKAGDKNEIKLTDSIIAIEQAYLTKAPQEAFYESHKEMIDFQMVINGNEIFFVAPTFVCEVKTPLKDDVIEYFPSKFASSLNMFKGALAVFESNDVHAGGISGIQSSTQNLVQKVVVKIPKNLIKLNF